MNIKSGFSSFSSNKIDECEKFYRNTLGLKVSKSMGGLQLYVKNGGEFDVFIYPKDDHKPASFTVLNIVVEDIEKAVDELAGKGVKFEIYDGFGQDEKGIARPENSDQGPPIAWFKDPAGNIIAVLE